MQKTGLFSWAILGELINLAKKEHLLPMYEELGLTLQSWAFNKSSKKDLLTHASS
jgi:hypothetical protein